MSLSAKRNAPICPRCKEDFYKTCPECGEKYLPEGAGSRMAWDNVAKEWRCTFCNYTMEEIREAESDG